MKRFMVRYYKDSDGKEIVTTRTIKAVDKTEANEMAEKQKPSQAKGYTLRDITGTY